MGSLKHKDDMVAGPEMRDMQLGNKLPLKALAMDVTSKGRNEDNGGQSERGKVVAREGEEKWREKSGERERQPGLGGSFARKLLIEGKSGQEIDSRSRVGEQGGRERQCERESQSKRERQPGLGGSLLRKASRWKRVSARFMAVATAEGE